MEPGGASSIKVKTLTNWLDLPRDLTIQIFIKNGVVDLLCSAQFVCSSWRAIARDPRLYRVIDLRVAWHHIYYKRYYNNFNNLYLKVATEAINRSGGQAIEFSIGGPEYEANDDILYQLKYKTPGLKCLRLPSSFDVTDCCMLEVIPKLPLLEEVEFCDCYFSNEVIQVLGRSCPNLKSFRWNKDCEQSYILSNGWNFEEQFNEGAFAVAGDMNPSLRSLHLFGNFMNNSGLEAILDRFSQLEYLDLRQCFNLNLNGDLLKRCQGIKTLRLPKDSTDGYGHIYEDAWWPSEDEEDDSDGNFNKDDDTHYSDGDSDKDEDDNNGDSNE